MSFKPPFLHHLSWTAIQELDKDKAVLVLPIGATEQHGPHLPVITDSLQVTRVLETACELLPSGHGIWLLPTLPFGKSSEHLGFPGTISLKTETLLAVLKDIGHSVSLSGFRKLVFVNGHGGNNAVLDACTRDIRAETGLLCFSVQPGYWLSPPFGISPSEQRLGIHAGELETSLMLHLSPELVHMDKALCHYPDFPDGTLHLTGQTSVAWLTRDWSASGIFGDATAGTADKGAALLQQAAQRLATVLMEISQLEVAHD